jgi:hypothetical protein
LTSARVREAVEERLKDLADQSVAVLESHLHGDDPQLAASAAKVLLSKTQGDARPRGTTIELPELEAAGSYAEKVDVIGSALATGRITLEQSQGLLTALRSAQEIRDAEAASLVLKLVRKGRSLKDAIALADRMSPKALLELVDEGQALSKT